MNNCKEEDKKFVSQAVAYVIKHSHKGIVPLCASLASLFQEQDRLKKQVRALQESTRKQKKNKYASPTSYLQPVPQAATLDDTFSSEVNSTVETAHSSVSHAVHDDTEISCQGCKEDSTLEQGSGLLQRVSRPIVGCLCQQCSDARKLGLQCVVPPLKCGDCVIFKGELCGTVQYVGHVDFSGHPHLVFVGIKLDETVGDNDGTICGKKYFTCPPNYGMFIRLDDVLCIVK